ncbi:hypothetical protein [Desulfovibrio inopinatus]|uniref:hypothetical protein n=1 Tax=Desulfovibrio inopinatus TaxID=102109 RepID=UPI0004296E5B|nr:hypothetical protein [Desulfovibrio inopinatus]
MLQVTAKDFTDVEITSVSHDEENGDMVIDVRLRIPTFFLQEDIEDYTSLLNLQELKTLSVRTDKIDV